MDPVLDELNDLKLFCETKGIDGGIVNRISNIIKLTKAREAYCAKISSPSSNALQNLATETKRYPWEEAYREGRCMFELSVDMMSGYLEGNCLQSLISMSKAKKVLEIGMFTGYSALAMAEVLPPDGTVTTCEIDPFLKEFSSQFFAKSVHGRKITVLVGPAKKTLLELAEEGQKFDFVFIDADKDGYRDYFETVMEKNLLSAGGTLVFDNAFVFGTAYNNITRNYSKSHIQELNEYLATRSDLFRVLIPVRDGMLIVRRKADTYSENP